jgi:toxin ParE1/3/4
MIVLKRPAAVRDLEEISDYFAARAGAALALRFLDASEKTLAFLARFPSLGALCPLANQRYQGIREWRVKTFRNIRIFYRPLEGEGVEVFRVIHAARDIPTILEGDT